MKKRWIMLLVVVILGTASTISTTVVLAGGEDVKASSLDKLSTRVAAILGLDVIVVDDAIKQARRELWDEALQAKLTALEAKLTAMVEQGELTQELAAEKLEAFQSELNYDSALKKKAISKGEAPQAKLTALEAKLTAMVDKGELTQEQANDKLKWIQAKKTVKAGSS